MRLFLYSFTPYLKKGKGKYVYWGGGGGGDCHVKNPSANSSNDSDTGHGEQDSYLLNTGQKFSTIPI